MPWIKRAITSGLIAGGTVTFFILIGIPGGSSDEDSLPAWFAWALFLLITGLFAYFAVRTGQARRTADRRALSLPEATLRGLVVGLSAAAVVILVAVLINAGQLWERSLPEEAAQLPNGLQSNITRVQDVFANVSPRTTAVLAGLPAADLNVPPDQDRPDPVGRFFLMACLFPVAAVVGTTLSWLTRRIQDRRIGQVRAERARWLNWLPVILPALVFIFIVLNTALPTISGIGEQYQAFMGGNAQLAVLVASFLLIATGMLGIRAGAGIRDATGYPVRAAVLIAMTAVIFLIGLAAPSRNPIDMLFSPKAPNPVQITAPDGSVQVTTDTPPDVDGETLHGYRNAVLIIVGLFFVVGELVVARSGARNHSPFLRQFATTMLLSMLVVMPLYLDKYQQSVLLLVGINIMLGLGLNIVVGYAGLLDLGYVAFFAIGAYVYAFLSSNQDIRDAGTVVGLRFGGNDQFVQDVSFVLVVALVVAPVAIAAGLWLWRRNRVQQPALAGKPAIFRAPARRPGWLSYALLLGSVLITLLVIGILRGTPFYDSFKDFPAFIIGILLGMIIAAFAGVLLGIPVLRLRGDYLAIVTLGFGEIIRLFLNNLSDITGGPQGIVSIPHPAVGSVEIGSNEGLLYLVLAGCILVAFVSLRLKSSQLGRAWGALRSDEDIAQAMGVNIVNAKVLAFAIGAAFAGIGGVIFAARQANIFPDNFTLNTSVNVLSLIIIGGMGSIPGVVVGALVLIGVPESLRVFENYRVMAFGALLVAMMLLRPYGLLPEPPQQLEQRARTLTGKEPA